MIVIFSLSLSLHAQLLIGYEHNYLELWDALTWKPIAIYGPLKGDETGDILATCWHSSGTRFLTSHQTGEINFWNLSERERPYMVKRLHGGWSISVAMVTVHALHVSYSYGVRINVLNKLLSE